MKPGYIRPLDLKQGCIDLTHGAGGRASHQLVQELFLPAFKSTWPADWIGHGDDGALLPMPARLPNEHRLVLSTDGHVVSPLFFPGGDIGTLAIHGTVNDLAMMGATPLHLTTTFILEEGLPLSTLRRVVHSMAEAARLAGVAVVAGDTKVVERGKCDGLYISTAGLGWAPAHLHLSGQAARPGDAVLLSGPVGQHGMAVLSQRKGLDFDVPVVSDCAPLNGLVQAMLATGARIKTLRDATRGGVATCLNEIAHASGVGMVLDESFIPVEPAVQAACDILGLDPLYLANEGRLLAICAQSDAPGLLQAMRAHPLGQQACQIGQVIEDPHGFVQMRTPFGGTRVLDWLMGDPLPRIC